MKKKNMELTVEEIKKNAMSNLKLTMETCNLIIRNIRTMTNITDTEKLKIAISATENNIRCFENDAFAYYIINILNEEDFKRMRRYAKHMNDILQRTLNQVSINSRQA